MLISKKFKIGLFAFEIEYTNEITIPNNFLLFEDSTVISEYKYTIVTNDSLEEPEGNLVAKRKDIAIYRINDLESRLLGIKGQNDYYASYNEIDEKHAKIVLIKNRISDLNIDPVFTSLLALERRMLKYNSLILHCAYLEHHGSAILFSAPSGTGKSTQASLWEKYENGKTINGDRGLLQKIDDEWVVGGWPVCGSSEICNNLTMPIKAIVMLSQDKTNQVTQLKGMKAFQQIYSQITINHWDKKTVNNALNLIEDMINKIPVYHLACDISKDAVECLKNFIQKQ